MYAAVALVAAVPSGALAAVTVSTTTIQAPPGDIAAGATVSILCQAEGNTTGGMISSTRTTIDRIDVTVSDGAGGGGTVTPTSITGAVSQTCSSGSGTCSWLSGSVLWATPAVPATLTAICTVSSTNTTTNAFGSSSAPGSPVSSAASATTVAGAALPPLVVVSGPSQLVSSATGTFRAAASDQNVPALPLTYAWSVNGTAVPGATGAELAWQAPAAPGSYAVQVTVSNGVASGTATKAVRVVLAEYQGTLPVALQAPRRLSAAQDGFAGLYVVDGRQPGAGQGQVSLLTVRGDVRGVAAIPEPALAVAQGAGYLWVTTTAGGLYRIDSGSGRTAGKIALADGPFLKPMGIAYEPSRMNLWVADMELGRVRVLKPDGTTVAAIATAGAVRLGTPVDVAADSAGGKVWVLTNNPNASGTFLHAYDLDGGYLGSYLASTVLSRGGGVAVGPNGRVYVSDAYQGVVEVLERNGTVIGTVGTFGESAGQLIAPAGIAVLPNGDIAVATPTNGRVERYGTGAPLPSCQVNGLPDSDCDGLPDVWELAHGLNPHFPGDALLAFGLTAYSNFEAFALGLENGSGPADPPTLVATAPRETPPGLVRMHATASSPGAPVAVEWRQASGPATVALSGASTGSASFVARVPGVYVFDVSAATAAATSAARVSVEVKNLAPVPDAGRVVVASPGAPVRLDARFSSDANGDELEYAWDQTVGRAVAGAEGGAALTVRPRGPGLYVFQVTATDARGASSMAEVPLVVAAGPVPTAVARAAPAEAQVGQRVVLDARPSLVAEGAGFAWQRIAGPDADLAGAGGPVASFTPSAAGRYVFGVSVVEQSGLRSPMATVEVLVAAAGASLPEVTAASAAAGVVAVGQPVALEATGTGSGYAWRQVAGPAAGLTDADRGTATAVPFSPGHYAFEVAATDGVSVGRPARVAFEARADDAPIPVARASAVGRRPLVGQLVFLDGRKSTGAARYRWTQVAGPWVAVHGLGAVATFRPHAAGTYAFELEVDDGQVRSAPARVEIAVTPRAERHGDRHEEEEE